MTFNKNAWEQEGAQKPLEEEDELGRKYVATIDGHRYEVYLNIEYIPNRWWLPLWELYEISLNVEDSIQEQRSYDFQDFLGAMTDHEYHKTLVLQDGEPVGLMLGLTNLEKTRVNYVNPEYLRRRFPDAVANNRLLYVTIVYFSPEMRSIGFFNWFISLVAQMIAKSCDVFVGEASQSRIFIKDAIRKGAERAGVVFKGEEIIGTQTYFALLIDKVL
jgi:hypothetical protein